MTTLYGTITCSDKDYLRLEAEDIYLLSEPEPGDEYPNATFATTESFHHLQGLIHELDITGFGYHETEMMQASFLWAAVDGEYVEVQVDEDDHCPVVRVNRDEDGIIDMEDKSLENLRRFYELHDRIKEKLDK